MKLGGVYDVRDMVSRKNPAADGTIGSVEIPLYFQVYYYSELLARFLNEETKTEFVWRAVKSLAKASAQEIAGKVIPFLGVIETTIDLLVPQLARDLEDMAKATTVMDRLFILHDNLTRLEQNSRFLEQWFSFTREAAADTSKEFQDEMQWLLATLAGATARL